MSFFQLHSSHHIPLITFQELLSNEMLRTQEAPSAQIPTRGDESSVDLSRYRFCRSVWELHSKIFQGYGLWLDHVDLKHARTTNAKAMLKTSNWDSPQAVNGLITELAMYFLVGREYDCVPNYLLS